MGRPYTPMAWPRGSRIVGEMSMFCTRRIGKNELPFGLRLIRNYALSSISDMGSCVSFGFSTGFLEATIRLQMGFYRKALLKNKKFRILLPIQQVFYPAPRPNNEAAAGQIAHPWRSFTITMVL